jgi:DNA polymerase-4
MPRNPAARICCLDLDTFFVSVERLLDASLEGKAVIVGGKKGQRGVVTAASYEVRAFGVRSGMSMIKASQLAPDAIYLPTRHGEYSAWSAKVMDLARDVCPQVTPASIDEAYLDFTGCEGVYQKPGDRNGDATVLRVVQALRQRIQDELGLPASVGIGATRSVAKMASGHAKPAGVWMVDVGDELDFVDLLPVRAYPGIGPVSGGKLVAAGIHTLGQLLRLEPGPLRATFGGQAERVRRGIDGSQHTTVGRRPAFREHDPQDVTVGSISNERTFSADVGDDKRVEDQIRALAERVCWRARKRGIRSRTIGLKLRYSDFHTITRSKTIAPTDVEGVVFREVLELFRKARTRKLAIRLVGVQLSNLVGPEQQLSLPFERESTHVGQAVDDVRKAFGYDAIRLGSVGKGRTWLA